MHVFLVNPNSQQEAACPRTRIIFPLVKCILSTTQSRKISPFLHMPSIQHYFSLHKAPLQELDRLKVAVIKKRNYNDPRIFLPNFFFCFP